MASSSPEDDPATYFGFKDLHGFKDFVIEVIAGAPDSFMEMDWLSPDDQMNLRRAFIGLRYGLNVTAAEKGEDEVIKKCRRLVEESFSAYHSGQDAEGQKQLEEMERLLSMLPSR